MPEEVAGEKKALDLSKEMPLIEGVEIDEELLLARDLTSAFVKAIKAFRFYPPDNPTLKGFRDTLIKKFQFFLNKYDSFVIQIGEYTLTFKGKVLYENRDIKTSLAFLFYKDGLKELRFKKGLEGWEVQGFIDIIKRSDSINQLEDDLVTLIWEKDFNHISHLATDEFLEETPVLIPNNIDQFRQVLVFKPIAHHVKVDLLEEDPERIDLYGILSKQFEELHSFVKNRNAYLLTPEEVEGLRKEVESEIDPTFVFNIVDILFEILFLEKEPEPYQDSVNTLDKILDALLTLGEFQKASDLLNRFNHILTTHGLMDWQRESIQKFIVEAGGEQRIERIGRILEKEGGVPLEDVSGYLMLLQWNSVIPLIHLLGGLQNSKARRVICDVLSEVGRDSLELFTPFIDDRRWYLVRNITYILGRIGKEQSLPYIQKALNHSEFRVRREAIQALGLIGGPKAVGSLVKALKDEDVRIRAITAINLGKVGKRTGLVSLLEIIQSKEFQKREPAEMKAFFDAIGMMGSNEAIAPLRQLLERKSWFGLGKRDEVRLGAANALAMIGTPESRAILESGKNARDDAIRDACSQALRRKPSREPLI